MEKAIEDNNSEVYECMRCRQNYCTKCNDSVEIDFDVNKEEEDSIVTKDDEVCPFCYNQLLEKFNVEVKSL